MEEVIFRVILRRLACFDLRRSRFECIFDVGDKDSEGGRAVCGRGGESSVCLSFGNGGWGCLWDIFVGDYK